MKDAINKTTMKIVHDKLVILGVNEEENTPPGFTSALLLLDSSHCTSHCYSTYGWLSIDVFTCGPTNPVIIMDDIINQMKKHYPSIKCTYNKNHKRFHYI